MDLDRNRKRLSAPTRLCLLVVVLSGLAACGERLPETPFALRRASFDDLPGWRDDDLAGAVAAFQHSCLSDAVREPGALLRPAVLGLTVGNLRPACEAAAQLGDGTAAARAFFTRHFSVWQILSDGDDQGLFTGYYVPQLAGSRTRGGPYQIPLYRRPDELVMVDLGEFRKDLKGRRLAGSVVNGRLKPFAARVDIDAGALAGRALELVWVTSAVDAFFLHIQGSGQIALDTGETIRVGYDGANGQPYVAIGRRLIDRGELEPDAVSLQSIKAWMAANPDRAIDLMRENPSYVFFRELPGSDVLGADGTPLTAERSLAVDRRYVPLGLPYWVATTLPTETSTPYQRLFIAQDTGGAIRGGVRGDIFFGAGTRAEALAGRMKQPGCGWLLLPEGFTPAIADEAG